MSSLKEIPKRSSAPKTLRREWLKNFKIAQPVPLYCIEGDGTNRFPKFIDYFFYGILTRSALSLREIPYTSHTDSLYEEMQKCHKRLMSIPSRVLTA